jgi:predicted enzyme related to lactoylglutathione lyase
VTDALEATYAFTKLVVRDLDAMTRYYGKVYGLAPIQRVTAEIAGSPIEEIILGRDGSYGGLILLHWVGQPAPARGELILGFTTPDIAALFARAESAGGAVRKAPEPSEEAGGLVVGFVEDPEGHLAEVVEQQ